MNSPTNETGRDALAPAPPVAGAMGLYSRDEENLIADVMNESGATRAVVIQEQRPNMPNLSNHHH